MKNPLQGRGMAASLIAAVLLGGSQIFTHEARISAIEDELGIEAPTADIEGAEEILEVVEEAAEEISDEDQIEAAEAEAEAQPLIEAVEE